MYVFRVLFAELENKLFFSMKTLPIDVQFFIPLIKMLEEKIKKKVKRGKRRRKREKIKKQRVKKKREKAKENREREEEEKGKRKGKTGDFLYLLVLVHIGNYAKPF